MIACDVSPVAMFYLKGSISVHNILIFLKIETIVAISCKSFVNDTMEAVKGKICCSLFSPLDKFIVSSRYQFIQIYNNHTNINNIWIIIVLVCDMSRLYFIFCLSQLESYQSEEPQESNCSGPAKFFASFCFLLLLFEDKCNVLYLQGWLQ